MEHDHRSHDVKSLVRIRKPIGRNLAKDNRRVLAGCIGNPVRVHVDAFDRVCFRNRVGEISVTAAAIQDLAFQTLEQLENTAMAPALMPSWACAAQIIGRNRRCA